MLRPQRASCFFELDVSLFESPMVFVFFAPASNPTNGAFQLSREHHRGAGEGRHPR